MKIQTILAISAIVLGWPQLALADAEAEGFEWPGNARVAVSLSYDDALDSQLDNAVPVLNKHNLKASFYLLLASPVVNDRLAEWKAVAEAGHELGNHTLFHPCSKSAAGRDWVPAYHDLDKRTLEQMRQEVATANAFLQAIDGRRERTLTPPCGDRKVSDGDYLAAVRDWFVAVKGLEGELPQGTSAYLVPEAASGAELIAFVKKAAGRGGVANIIFHGIGGDHLSNSVEAHEELVRFLAENRDTYWTATYIDIMRHLSRARPVGQE